MAALSYDGHEYSYTAFPDAKPVTGLVQRVTGPTFTSSVTIK